MKKMSFLTMILIAAAAAAMSGCQGARRWTYLSQSPDQTLVKPEYPIKDKTVAVVIYAENTTLYEYPNVRLTLGTKVCNELENSLENVKTISPFVVSRYQDDHVNWEALDQREICKDLKVDLILIVTLAEYRTREPGLMNTYQAKIVAEAKIFTADATDTAPVWELEKAIEEVFPKDPRYDAQVEPLIRDQAEKMVAAELTRKFCKHSYTVDSEGEKKFQNEEEK